MHTATAEEPAGTVLTSSNFTASIDFSALADQVLVYRGSITNPTFLCALDNSRGYQSQYCPGSVGGWHQDSCAVSWSKTFFSDLPSGLTDGVNAPAWLHKDSWAYA
eukprot:1039558-Prymnesium_polylepis.1